MFENPLIEEAGKISEKEELIGIHERLLQDHFIELREYKEMPITKDNCEALFENWLDDMDLQDLINIID